MFNIKGEPVRGVVCYLVLTLTDNLTAFHTLKKNLQEALVSNYHQFSHSVHETVDAV